MKKTIVVLLTAILLSACNSDDGNSIIEQQSFVVPPPALLLNTWSLTGGERDDGGILLIDDCISEELDFMTNRDFYRKFIATRADSDPITCITTESEGIFYVNPEKTEVTTIIGLNKVVRKIVKLDENELHLKMISSTNNELFIDFTIFYTKVN
ncbi:hypothetical protein [Aquimarina sp. RZ0]|uniref:hypothetical protein n=1 Tax=Aquimarina sp. RZ0 TaxID=2607730 RepID=UPI0011F3A680|nr:hypothetical protein [Aquimarina sp. RZ0]KAA1242893.1 hypothetical protein F0000_23435 [Aquimarina sp. RZ0]